jgi:VanZ family protein
MIQPSAEIRSTEGRSTGPRRGLWVARIAAVTFTLLLTYFLVAPAPLALFGVLGDVAQQRLARSVTDSVQHAVAYAIFTALWILATRKRTSRLAVIGLAVLHGAATEAVQALMPPRHSDWFDMLANLCGITSGAVLAWFAASVATRRQASTPADVNRSRRASLLRGFERILLYSVALVLGASLLLDRPREEQSQMPENHPDNRANPAADLRPAEQAPDAAAATPPIAPDEAPAAPEPRGEALRNSLVLVDGQGRARIELRVGDDGQPRLALNDESGQAVIQLRADSRRSGQIVLETGRGTARLVADSDRFALELQTDAGPLTRVAITPDGQAEVIVRSEREGPRATLRTDPNGSAEVSVGGSAEKPAATLIALGGGHLELRMTGAGGAAGPRLQLFEDATAQLTLDGPGSHSGPSLIRFADGTSVVAVRRSDGNPAGSMVAAPDGTAVIAAASPRDGQQAELRVSPDGKATIAVVEPNPERPDVRKPPAAPARPLTRPPTVLSAP